MFKVMIIDDERHIRNGIISLIDWNKMKCEVVSACANGLEAVDYLKNNAVDIIVSDIKMPGMSGLEVAEYVNINKPEIKVILLTAYADFTNAQLAIKHNVSEYVVKTEFIDELPTAIMHVQNKIEDEKRQENNIKALTSIINENKENLKNRFLIDVAQNSIDEETIKRKINEFDLTGKLYYVITYEVKFINKLSYHCSNDEYNTVNMVFSFVSTIFKEYEYSILKMGKNFGIIVVYLKDNSIKISDLIELCKDVEDMVNQLMNFSIKFAISERCEGIENLSFGYKQALLALSKIYSSDTNVNIYSYKDEKIMKHNEFNEDLEREYIQELVRQGNINGIKRELKKTFDYFTESNLSLEQAKVKVIILLSYCLKLYENYKIEQKDLKDKETIIYKEINESKSMQSLFESSCFIMEQALDIFKNSENTKSILVREVNKYIRNNYNKNIGLATIAKCLHVNSSYLSRLYKKETGTTLIDALNGYRIDIAKKLLKQVTSKVSEVGAEVGIEDPAYFTHVFTKYCGCSPKEYKSKCI